MVPEILKAMPSETSLKLLYCLAKLVFEMKE